jgi:Cu/Ag efflux protein CusF
MPHPASARVALAIGALLASLAQAATAADAAASGLSHTKVVGASVSTTGTITAIDVGERLVTVKNAQGTERIFRVDPKVPSLENLKVGDRVGVDYLVAVAVALRKGGGDVREKVEDEAKSHEPTDGKPGMQAARRTTYVANVLAVNRAQQTVRLKGPAGRVGDIRVEDKAALADVKVGDQVVAVVYEAVAVGVRPAGASGAAASATR